MAAAGVSCRLLACVSRPAIARQRGAPACLAPLAGRAFLKSSSGSSSRGMRRKPCVAVRAEQGSGDINSPAGQQQQPSSGGPEPPQKEETLGLFGNIVIWSILLVTFAGSLFFTFSRQLLPDLVALDPNAPAPF